MVDDEIGLVMLTSGSSGSPKAAELTWTALELSATITERALRGSEPSTWFPCLPPNHIGGLAVILRAVLGDARLTWTDSSDFAGALKQGATHVALVRAQLARHDVTGFTTVLLGGARPPSLVATNVVSTWGMTETGSGVVYDGRPLDGVEIASVEGELIVRSPTLFRSYRTMPRPFTMGPDGKRDWFPTGDAGEVANGIVRVFGRLDFVINSGGEKIWPEDLEAVLANVAGVKDVAVSGVDDDQWGQRVIAFVVGDDPGLDVRVREAAEEHIGPWAKPKEIRFVKSIPRTSNGKIRRGELASL